MAWICPNCAKPEAIAYVVNEYGLNPFPCLYCNGTVLNSGGRSTQWATAACENTRCAGVIRDLYHYSPHAGLTEVARFPCHECGSGNRQEEKSCG